MNCIVIGSAKQAPVWSLALTTDPLHATSGAAAATHVPLSNTSALDRPDQMAIN